MPAHSAPQVVLGKSGYDHREDICAVGCVRYWLLGGRLVFEATLAMAMLVDHAKTEPPRLRSRTELPIPTDLEQLIMECLEKDPARRPGTAAEPVRGLAACTVEDQWTPDRAERLVAEPRAAPDPGAPRRGRAASREGSWNGGRELRPRREKVRMPE